MKGKKGEEDEKEEEEEEDACWEEGKGKDTMLF